MPIYEYSCEKCGHTLETIQKFSDPVLTDCPACKEPALKKLVSVAAFQLKGTGWYQTDFRDKGKKPDDNKDKEKSKEHQTGESGETKEPKKESSAKDSKADATPATAEKSATPTKAEKQ